MLAQRFYPILLISGALAAFPVYAESQAPGADSQEMQSVAEPEAGQMDPEEMDSEENESEQAPPAVKPALMLEYRIGGGEPQALQVGEPDPLSSWLTVLQQSAQAAKQQQKPVNTQVRILGGDDKIAPFLEKFPALQLETAYEADGKGHTVFNQAPFNYRMTEKGEAGSLEWQGLQGRLDFSADLQTPAFEFKAPGLLVNIDDPQDRAALRFGQLSGALALDADNEPARADVHLAEVRMDSSEGVLKLRNFDLSFLVKEVTAGLKLGDGSLNIGHFSFSDKNTTEVAADNLRLSGNGTLDQAAQTVTYTVGLSTERLLPPRTLLKTQDQGINYHATLVLDKLDAAAITDLQKTLRQLKKQGLPPEMIGLSIMGKFFEVLPALLAKSPQIELREFKLDTGNGTLEAHAQIGVDGGKPIDFSNPQAITNVLRGTAELSVSKSILEDALRAKFADAGDAGQQEQAVRQELEKIQQEGMLVADGERYKLSAVFKEGKLLVNGKEQPLGIQ